MTDHIQKTRQLFDEGTESWFDEYQAPGVEGRPVTAIVPREDQQPNLVKRQLLKKGAALFPEPELGKQLTAAIASDATIVHRAPHNGWQDGGHTFVSQIHVARGMDASYPIIPPESGFSGSLGNLQCKGDLESWQEVAKLGVYSTSLAVALSAAFAAPLLRILNRSSFAVVFVGPSGSGKSTAQLLGASVIGFPSEGDLPPLMATPAGILAAANAFNDHMIPINEVGTARGAKRDIYDVLHNTTYALTSGQDVVRHPSWVGTVTGSPKSFYVIPLLSSEHSPDVWAARNGEVRDEGETRRLIGLPVLGNGSDTIYDHPPKNKKGDVLKTWEREKFAVVREAISNQCGVPFSAYLDAIVTDKQAATARAHQLVALFENKVGKPTMSRVARDVVAKFGVLFAGGIIAIEKEILPFPRKRLGFHIQEACLRALAALPDPKAELRGDLRLLDEHLGEGGIVDLTSCDPKQRRMMHNADGYWQPTDSGTRYVIRAQIFATWFQTPLRVRRVLEWLEDEGYLEHSRDRTHGRSNEWAQTQVKWPGGTRLRSICIFFPDKLSTLIAAA